MPSKKLDNAPRHGFRPVRSPANPMQQAFNSGWGQAQAQHRAKEYARRIALREARELMDDQIDGIDRGL